MLTLLIVFACSIAGVVVGLTVLNSTGWAITLGIAFFALPAVVINLWVKRRLEKVFNEVQRIIERDQETLRRKMNQLQNKMGGANKGIQKQLEKKQADGIRDALAVLDQAEPLYKWNILAKRQTNTVRAQMLFQIKDFSEADQYLEKALIMDPFTLAMKMVRLYKQGKMEEVEKAYKKGRKRFKYEKGVLIYALYSWILVKEQRIDDAIEVLNEGKDNAESPVLEKNWEYLVNGRVKQFSNAGLGEQWYGLHLETPKPVRVKQRGGRRFR